MANELAMTLELGGFGDAAFRNVSASIKVSRSLSKDHVDFQDFMFTLL